MNKSEIPHANFWAKKFDTQACITTKDNRTLCGKYNALLGNNYASRLNQVCDDCVSKMKPSEVIHFKPGI